MIVRLQLRLQLKTDPDPHPVLEYTAKLSKTLLIKMNPHLRQLFARRRAGPPKPVAITPPLNPRSLEPIAATLVSHRRPDPSEFKPTLLTSGEIVIHLTLPNTVLRLLPPEGSTARFRIWGATVTARLTTIEPLAHAPSPDPATPSEPPAIETLTPYLPKDPYTHSKYSSFNLAPDTTLSIPAYIHTRILSPKKSLHRTLTTLRRCLILPHTGYCRMRKTWYLARARTGELKPLPALTGALQYKLNTLDCTRQEQQETTQIIQLATITGIGKSRAAGLGTLKLPTNKP